MTVETETNHYETLGVSPEANLQQIQAAFRDLIRRYRDRAGETDLLRIDRARQINIAHTTLSNPVQRRKYDESLGIVPAAANLRTQPPVAEDDGESESHALEPQRLVEPPTAPPRRSWYPVAGALLLVAIAGPALIFQSRDRPSDELSPKSVATDPSQPDNKPASTDTPLSSMIFREIDPPRDGVARVRVDAADGPRPALVQPRGETATAALSTTRPPEPTPDRQPSAVQPAPSSNTKGTESVDQTRKPAEPERSSPSTTAPAPSTSKTSNDSPESAVGKAASARWLGGGLTDADNRGGRFSGTVGVRFLVEPAGSITDCRTDRSSGDPFLDRLTCDILSRRLRFQPAIDSNGKPVASENGATFTWGRRSRRR